MRLCGVHQAAARRPAVATLPSLDRRRQLLIWCWSCLPAALHMRSAVARSMQLVDAARRGEERGTVGSERFAPPSPHHGRPAADHCTREHSTAHGTARHGTPIHLADCVSLLSLINEPKRDEKVNRSERIEKGKEDQMSISVLL